MYSIKLCSNTKLEIFQFSPIITSSSKSFWNTFVWLRHEKRKVILPSLLLTSILMSAETLKWNEYLNIQCTKSLMLIFIFFVFACSVHMILHGRVFLFLYLKFQKVKFQLICTYPEHHLEDWWSSLRIFSKLTNWQSSTRNSSVNPSRAAKCSHY